MMPEQKAFAHWGHQTAQFAGLKEITHILWRGVCLSATVPPCGSVAEARPGRLRFFNPVERVSLRGYK